MKLNNSPWPEHKVTMVQISQRQTFTRSFFKNVVTQVVTQEMNLTLKRNNLEI